MKSRLMNFNFEKTEKDYFVSNDFGEWLILSEKEFDSLKSGNFLRNKKLSEKLKKSFFLANCLDLEKALKRAREMSPVLNPGPSLHIIVLTLKCNHRCVYCRTISENDGKNTDMSEKTAFKSVRAALSSPNGDIALEFQGGEALLNWKVFQKAALCAFYLNREKRKNLKVSVVTNLSLMDEEKFRFLTRHGISVCSSLDGPGPLHDANRIFLGGSSYALAVKWLRKFAESAGKNEGRRDSLPSALMTTTRKSLKFPVEIVDEYRKLGLGGIFIRPLSPIGCAGKAFDRIGYTAGEFAGFYGKALDYILDINLKGKKFVERTAAIILAKMLEKKEPNYLDLRSPCGATVGQAAYNWNGDVYTCDEGRMLGSRGDFTFKTGNVNESGYLDSLNCGSTRMCLMTSCLENQPECFRCAFKPFCGVCPVHNLEEQNSPWGNMKMSYWCRVQKGIFQILVKKLKSGRNRKIFKSWFNGEPD